PGTLDEADAWYFILEGTREPSVAEAQALALTELAAQEFVVPESTSRTRLLVERSFRERGLALKIAQQLTGTEPVKKAVEANLGVGIVSSHAVNRELAAGYLCSATVDHLVVERYFEMIGRADKYFSPAGQTFQEFVRTYLADGIAS
ncbi:MAG: LysR substrate-binding domain-containing protein, partial [Chloroflexota bacterium]